MPGVTVRVLGCGDAFASGGRFQACFMVASGGQHCLLDCGATTLVAMRRLAIDPATLDAVFLSHLHGDHFGGLPFLLLDAQFAHARERPLAIAGPPGTRDRVMAATEVLFPGAASLDWRFALSFHELAAGRTDAIGSFAITPFPAVHPSGAPSYSLRLRAGDRTVAYSGDTEWTDTLLQVAVGADLFIVECSGFDTKALFHIDYNTLKPHLNVLSAKRVVLTHMGEAMLAQVGNLDVEGAEDGQLIEL